MSGLKITLSDVTSFLPDNSPGLKEITFRRDQEKTFFNAINKSFASNIQILYADIIYDKLFHEFFQRKTKMVQWIAALVITDMIKGKSLVINITRSLASR